MDAHAIALAGLKAHKLAEEMVVLVQRAGVPAAHLDEVFEWLSTLLQQDSSYVDGSAQVQLPLDAIDQVPRD